MKWYLRYRLKYNSKYYNQKEIAGAVGTAFSTYQEFIEEGHDKALQAALDDYSDIMKRLEDTRECMQMSLAYKEAAPARLEKLIDLFVRKNPIPSSWEMFDRERAFPNHGNSRVDSMYRTSMQQIGVLDYKTRGRLQANQVDKARREFGTSGQLLQYCWMASEVYGQVVDQYSICFITLEPRPFIDLWQYRVKQSTLEAFIAGRKQVWADMEATIAGERTPYMSDTHENKFGICESHDVCFKYGFEESLLQEKFIILDS